MKIGVGITTRNRTETLIKALENHLACSETGEDQELVYVIINDSDIPLKTGTTDTDDIPPGLLYNLSGAFVNVNQRAPIGIAAAKNLCLTYLMLDEPCDHIFLFDDDAWPLVNYWWSPYVKHPEPHLQAAFAHGTTHSTPLIELYQDDEVTAYHRSRGYMLYYDRKVIERVGGMDLRFKYGLEHQEHSARIHSAGFTTFEHQDLNTPENLIYSLDSGDQEESFSTITSVQRHMYSAENRALFDRLQGRTVWVPYHPQRNIVLTCLLTTQPDTQRLGRTWASNPNMAKNLLNSLEQKDVRYKVFYDNDEMEAPDDDRWEKVITGAISPYLQRWITYRRWLTDHPDAHWVWCVDATDVTLLGDPWYGLEEDTLYCGWENNVCSRPWMLNNHDASREFLEKHADEMLLNPGVVGGQRHVVMQLCDNIIQCYAQGKSKGLIDKAGDMGYAQEAIRAMTYETGPAVTTLFKGYELNNHHSIWKHK